MSDEKIDEVQKQQVKSSDWRRTWLLIFVVLFAASALILMINFLSTPIKDSTTFDAEPAFTRVLSANDQLPKKEKRRIKTGIVLNVPIKNSNTPQVPAISDKKVSEINPSDFCLLILDTENQEQFSKQLLSITEQIYTKWTAWFYLKKSLIETLKTKLPQTENVKFVETFQNRGKNIYDGVVDKCSNESMVVVIKNKEKIAQKSTLFKFAEQFQKTQRNITFVVPSMLIKGKIIDPPEQIRNFSRDIFFPLHKKVDNISLINQITQHIRIFKAADYLRVPFIEFMFENETFFQSELSYILPILEIKQKQPNFNNIMLKSKIVLLEIQGVSETNNAEEIYQIGQRDKLMNETILLWKMRFLGLDREPTLWHLNHKEYNVLRRNISTEKKLIPAIIHQTWVGPIIPEFKKRFMSRFKKVMPDYEYILWGDADITKENFPITYEYIKKIQEIQKHTNYNKGSMISDLMRYEIIYRHGGFYFDTNYEPFKSFDNLRHYPFFCVPQRSSQIFEYYGTSLFGAQKNNVNVGRLISKENLDSIDYNSKEAHIVSGPRYFGKAFEPQDLYYNVKVLTPQKIFPYLKFNMDLRRKKDHCVFQTLESIPNQLDGTYDQILIARGHYVIFPCANQYPDAYGMDHWGLGSSWYDQISNQQRDAIINHKSLTKTIPI